MLNPRSSEDIISELRQRSIEVGEGFTHYVDEDDSDDDEEEESFISEAGESVRGLLTPPTTKAKGAGRMRKSTGKRSYAILNCAVLKLLYCTKIDNNEIYEMLT